MAEKKAIGGVLLGSAIGGYAGYKIGRARPQKSGFDTEKKIASKLKKGASKVKQDLKEGAEKRKKKKLATSMAKGGVTEHGLAKGDTITDDLFWENHAVIKDKDGKKVIVDLEKGERGVKYAKGGSSYAEGGEIDDGSSSGVWFTYGKGGTINDGWGINLKWW